MALVPEEEIFSTMAEERKLNTSPMVKSLANMDQEIKIEDNTMRPDTTLRQHHESIQSHFPVPGQKSLRTDSSNTQTKENDGNAVATSITP